MSEKMVGLSMSFCIQDMVTGKMDMNNVQFLSTATKCPTPEAWEDVLNSYKKTYWRKNPNEAEKLARYFIDAGLVIQPRLEEMEPVTLHSGD